MKPSCPALLFVFAAISVFCAENKATTVIRADRTNEQRIDLKLFGNFIELLDDVVPEYALSATRYFGSEQGPGWVSTLQGKPMARIAITPNWVGILDFQTRFPSALVL